MKNNIFKCFGISKSDIMSLLSPLVSNNQGVYVDIKGENLLVDIILKADENNFYFYEFTKEIFEKLNQYIYAETDISIEQVAFELLKINKLKFATVESLTAGQIICLLAKNNENINDVLIEGLVTISNNSKFNRLNISQNYANKNSNFGVKLCYDMANEMLKSSGADLVVATAGTSDCGLLNQSDGIVYIAIGDANRIDVFKNKFDGSKNQIIETSTYAALFYLIKKLRKNDFYLNENEL